MKTRLSSLLGFLALLSLFVGRPALAAGAVRVTVSPNVLLANGISTATVTAEVRTSSGRPARDGTEVRFYTTAGTITQVAFTSAGVARATLTSSSVPQAANISVSAGIDQTVITVPMVSKLVEATVGGRIMRITGQYVAFSEDRRFIQADEQVKIKFRGLQIEANSVQLDLGANTLKALGKIQIAADNKTMVGDRLWVDLATFEGYLMSVGSRQWFSGYGLTELPERPKNLNPDFELADISDSKLLWVGKQANYIIGERVQMQGARAFVGGIKSFKMPFHQANLAGGFNQTEQYVGIGSEGITLDLPLYLRMSPGASTALNVGYGSRSGGLGYFTRDRGLNVDLVQKYGFMGASEGEARLTNLASFGGWGAQWSHSQQLTKTTRIVSDLQFPEHRDFYGGVNLTSGLPIGTLQASVSGQKPQQGDFTKTLALAFETKPRPVLGGKANFSVQTAFNHRDPQQLLINPSSLNLDGSGLIKVPVGGLQTESVTAKLRPQAKQLAKGLTLESSVAVEAITGTLKGFGPAAEIHLNKTLPRNGFLTFGIQYDQLAQVASLLPTQGKINSTLSATVPITKKLKITALGNLALDAQSQSSVIQASYALSSKWRLNALQTMFQYGTFGAKDTQFGVSRALGERELALYWSQREHKFVFEFGASRF